MKTVNFTEQNTVINQYLAELRDRKYQQNRLLFQLSQMQPGEPSAVIRIKQ